MKRVIFISVVSILILISGCKKNETISPLTKAQKQAFNYLPEESLFIMYLNLNELRRTDFWEPYFKSSILGSSLNDRWFSKFENVTGAGINKGISQVFLASNGKEYNTAVIILDKKQNKIQEQIEQSGSFEKEFIADKPVYKLKGKPSLEFYFINDSTVLSANNFNYIKTVLQKGQNSLINNKSFINIIKNIKNKNQYWIAIDDGPFAINYIRKLLGVNEKFPVASILKSINGVTLAAQFDDGVDIESNWNCKDSKNAYLLSTAIKGALAMDLLAGGDYSLGKILQKTEVERLNSQVNLQLELKGDDINKLKDLAKQINTERKL